jgi:nucleotide-binding universal stress UspA family protein
MFPIHKILHPTDFSDRSDAAFRLACALARDYSATILVLHVSTPFVAYGDGLVTIPSVDYLESLREKVRVVKPPEPHIPVEHKLVEGDPATEVLRVAKDVGADLIVMGTHGWTGLARLLMGSVAEQVVRKAHCPVVTVRAPWPKEPGELPVQQPEAVGSAL